MHIAQQIARALPRYNASADPADTMRPTPADLLGATVDRLADIKAQIAALQAEEDELKNDLTESGAETIEGTLHRAAITYGSTRTTTNWQAVAQHLNPSRQLIKAHTTTGQPFDTVRIGAKKTS
jgi:N-methylhydantoinase B/oxoprolinase/acetone carboxylase alpha subunit